MSLPQDSTRIALEKKAGTKAARAIRSDLRREAGRFNEHTGVLKQITASRRMRKGELRAIAIVAAQREPHPFILNYGFVGTKKGGVRMRLEQSNWIGDAILNNPAVDTLATEISEARADQVVANIAFSNVSNPNRR